MRNCQKHPKHISSSSLIMKKFTDCLNQTDIFEETIPYLVIHQEKKCMSSYCKIKVTWKENVISSFIGQTLEEKNKQIFDYISKKLNDLPNMIFIHNDRKFTSPSCFTSEDTIALFLKEYHTNAEYSVIGTMTSMIDQTNPDCYYQYDNVAFSIWLVDIKNQDDKNDNDSTLTISLFNTNIPLFQMVISI